VEIARINHTPDWDPPADWADIRGRVLKYLNQGIVLIRAMGNGSDRHNSQAPENVPLGFCTDGMWIWALGMAYYIEKYDLSIDPDLLAHIREQDFEAPTPSDDEVSEAFEFLQSAMERYVDESQQGEAD